MTTVESRSIYNGPIRRSFDVMQNQARDLAEVVAALGQQLDDVTDAFETYKREGAERLVAVATPITYDISIGASTLAQVTNNISVGTTAGHYYRISMRLRGTSISPAQAIGISLIKDGAPIGDAYMWVGGNYVGINHEWLVFGDGVAHNFSGAIRAGGATTTVYGGDGHFYCEKLGVITP
jgi:hypothetical protein